MTVFQTARLTITPCTPDDRDDFIALERDPEVMHFLNGGRIVEDPQPDPAATYLMPRGTEPYIWAARRTADDTFVGWFCLWPETETLAELGYRLRRTGCGRGLASEGARALVGWGFAAAGYDRIVATTMTVNTASRRVMEKLGMRHTRTEHGHWPDPIPGSEHGEVWYELTRSEWAGG